MVPLAPMDHQFDESYPFVFIGHVCNTGRNIITLLSLNNSRFLHMNHHIIKKSSSILLSPNSDSYELPAVFPRIIAGDDYSREGDYFKYCSPDVVPYFFVPLQLNPPSLSLWLSLAGKLEGRGGGRLFEGDD